MLLPTVTTGASVPHPTIVRRRMHLHWLLLPRHGALHWLLLLLHVMRRHPSLWRLMRGMQWRMRRELIAVHSLKRSLTIPCRRLRRHSVRGHPH
jgi:hypothetical protein